MSVVQLSFPPEIRLRKPGEYKRVFAKPVRSVDRYFTILTRANDLNYPRLGLAITKKNFRKAVDRNLLKRIIRESFRLHQHDLDTIDIVVMASREAREIAPQKLTRALEWHWQKFKNRCDS